MVTPLSKPDIWWHWEIKNFRRVWIPVVAKTWVQARELLILMHINDPDPRLKADWRKTEYVGGRFESSRPTAVPDKQARY